MTATKDCALLGEQLVSEPVKHANNCITLLSKIGSTSTEEVPKAAIRALAVFFQHSISRGVLSLSKGRAAGADAQATFTKWLSRQVEAYLEKLTICMSGNGPTSVKVAALAALMDLCRSSPDKELQAGPLTKALGAILGSDSAQDVLQIFGTAYLQYIDVRYHTWRVIHALVKLRLDQEPVKGLDLAGLQDIPEADLATRIYTLLCNMPSLSKSTTKRKEPSDAQEVPEMGDLENDSTIKSWCGLAEEGGYSLSNRSEGAQKRRKRRKLEGGAVAMEQKAAKQKPVKWMTPAFQSRAFSDAWLSFLRLQMPANTFRKVLIKVHEDVLPFLANPLQLADLLSRALDTGGILGMTALHAIFVLVTKYGLEYPQFYARLYQLLKPDVFYAKFRSRFFQLADVFLSSPLVPAYTIASFIKRFARLSLHAPPAGALICVGFIHNLLRRHPACLVMLDRQDQALETAKDSSQDGIQTENPAKTGPDPLLETNAAAPVKAAEPLIAPQSTALSHSHTNGVAKHSQTNGVQTVGKKKSKLGKGTSRAEKKSQGTENAAQSTVGQASSLTRDPFLESVEDPAETQALDSSLWELKSLSNHYYNQVSAVASQTLAKDLQDKKKTAELDISALIGGSYSSLTNNELSRRLKQIPVAFYQSPPQKLFDESAALDFPGWNFS